MKGYIDVHSHILPGVDDGSKDWDMTKQMLTKVYEQEVKVIVATPHNYPEQIYDMAKIRELHQETQKIAHDIASDFEVLLGNEIYFRENIAEEIAVGKILTMAKSDFILVEFSPGEHYSVIFQGLKDLIESGYYPIIAHIERVLTLMEHEERLAELREMGCSFQANTEDMMGGIFDRGAAKLRRLAEKGYINILGSDCHNVTTRAPLMRDCMMVLKKKLSADTFKRLSVTNPERFLSGKYI